MEDDPIDPQDQGGGSNYPQRGASGGGGGGGIFSLLPLLLSLFRGKGSIALLVIIAVGYFLMRGCGGSGGGGLFDNIAQLATGGFLDPRQFERIRFLNQQIFKNLLLQLVTRVNRDLALRGAAPTRPEQFSNQQEQEKAEILSVLHFSTTRSASKTARVLILSGRWNT